LEIRVRLADLALRIGIAALAMLLAVSFGAVKAQGFYFGVDLSSVNAREACGATFRENGVTRDPFALFASRGANLVRVRLWNDPSGWTDFGNLSDVEKTIARAKAQKMKVLLDFHYSDRWADASSQIVPGAWRGITSDAELAKTLYQYTGLVLLTLDRAGLMPDLVQIGNETNSELMMRAPWTAGRSIDWKRNALLFAAAIRAVHDASARTSIKPKIILHIAQPENVEAWLDQATAAGVSGFDIIGISYYAKWSKLDLAAMGAEVRHVRAKYGVDVMIVETAYPATLDYTGFPNPDPDKGETLTAAQTLVPGFPATPQGQNDYMVKLTQIVMSNGGIGVIYWEPARVDVNCWPRARTDGDKGWQNATVFDRYGNIFPSFQYMLRHYDAGTNR